jgi:hypothetical protein
MGRTDYLQQFSWTAFSTRHENPAGRFTEANEVNEEVLASFPSLPSVQNRLLEERVTDPPFRLKPATALAVGRGPSPEDPEWGTLIYADPR